MANNDDNTTGTIRFFIYSDGRQHGPYDVHGLKEQGLSSETLVWRDGMDGWTPAWQVAELKQVLAGKDDMQDVPPPVEPQPAGREEDLNDVADRPVFPPSMRKGRHTRRKIILAVLALLLVVMALTCPGKETHKDAVGKEVERTISSMSGDGGSWGVIGDMMMSGIATFAVDQLLDVEDYVFFSIGSIRYGDRSKAVSFGIFNHVFTFDAEYVGQE